MIPEIDFIKELVKKLQRDITAEFLDTNFNSPRERKAFLEKVEKILNEYGETLKDTALLEMDLSWEKETKKVKDDLKKVPDEFFVLPNKQVLETMITLEKIKDDFGTEIDNLFFKSRLDLIRNLNILESRVKRNIITEITAGSITGDPRKIIAERVKQEFIKNGLSFSATDKNGKERNYSLESEANRITQHSIISSRMQATVRQAVSMGYDLIKVDEHSNPSPMCSPYQHKIVSITGITEGYETLESITWKGKYTKGNGVGHPWCRHSFTIYIPTKIKFKEYQGEPI